MQCHYCEEDASVAVEKDHLKVGLCGDHLRERIEELSEAGWLDDFQTEIDDVLD